MRSFKTLDSKIPKNFGTDYRIMTSNRIGRHWLFQTIIEVSCLLFDIIEITLEMSFVEEMRTTWGNKNKVLQTLFYYSLLSPKIDLNHLTPYHWQRYVSKFLDIRIGCLCKISCGISIAMFDHETFLTKFAYSARKIAKSSFSDVMKFRNAGYSQRYGVKRIKSNLAE